MRLLQRDALRDPQTAIHLIKRFIHYTTEYLPEEYIPQSLIEEAKEYVYSVHLGAPPTLSGGRDND